MNKYDKFFIKYTIKYFYDIKNFNWKIFKAQAICESNLNPQAISPVGAKGIAQFMDKTFEEWKCRKDADIFNPEDNICAQIRYIRWLYDNWDGDLVKMLISYNWGIGNLKRVIRKYGNLYILHIPKETLDYIYRIIKTYKNLNKNINKKSKSL